MNSVRALLVGLVFALPMGAAIVPGAEIPLDPATMVVPADGHDPRIASNGRDALVVWRDSRGHPDDSVRALSLKDGLPDGEELVLDEGEGHAFADVASNGDGYLVVYESFEGTFAVRVDAGRVTHRDAIEGRPLDLASNGSTYCLLTDDSGLWPKRVASFLDTTGALLAKLDVSADSERLVAMDGQYWLIENDGQRIELSAISPAGSGERRLLGDARDARISAIAGRDRMLVAWRSDRLHYVVLDDSGVPVSPLAMLNDEIPPSWQYPPSLAWDGSEFLLSWPLSSDDATRMGRMGAIRIGTDGARRNVEPFVVAGVHDEDRFDAAFDGTRVVLVDVDGHDDARVLRARAIEAFAMHPFEEGVALSIRGQSQSARATAASGETFLAVWVEHGRLRGLLRRAGGTTTPLEIATGSSTMPATVTAAGDIFLVTWQNEGGAPELLAKRVRSDGEVVDRDPLAIAQTGELPQVASDGTRFLVAWRETGRIRGVVIPAAGAMEAPATLAITRQITPSYLTVGWVGAAYVIAWSTDNPDEHTFIRAGADGTVLTTPTMLAQPGHWSGENGAIAIGARDDAAIAVWQERECLWSRPLRADGQSDGPPRTIACSPAVSRSIDVKVSWAGSSWLVLWSQRDHPHRLVGIRVDRDRRAIGEVSTLDVPFGRGLVRGTAIVGDSLWMLYDRAVPEPPYFGVRRTFVRPVYFEPQSRRARSIRR